MSTRIRRGMVTAVAAAAVAYRLQDFGRYGFWTDEAWVALVTRVDGLSQKWLAIGPTPPGWAATLDLVSFVRVAPEVTLRLLPLLGGFLAVAFAWDLGRRLAGDPLGGLLALAVVGFDPKAIEWSKILKQYSVEFALVLGVFAAAAGHLAEPRRSSRLLLLSLCGVGVAWASMLLVVAPPLLLVLCVEAMRRGDRGEARAWLLGGGLLGAWYLVWIHVIVEPRLGGALATYWRTFLPTDEGPVSALLFVLRSSARRSSTMLGPVAATLFASALTAHGVCGGRTRPLAWAFWLLFVELAALAWWGVVPFEPGRVLGFLPVTFGALAAGATVWAVRKLAAHRPLRPAVAVLLVVAGLDFVRVHPWARLGAAKQVEDAGPLVRRIERERTEDDTVLVYDRSLFVYAYYARQPPVLRPAPSTTVGYVPDLGRGVVVLPPDRIEQTIVTAARSARTVWLLFSRVRARDGPALVAGIRRAPADVVGDVSRENARLIVLKRRADEE